MRARIMLKITVRIILSLLTIVMFSTTILDLL